MGKKKDKKRSSEIITRDDELKLIIDMQQTKNRYEELIADLRVKQSELKDALEKAKGILSDMNEKMKE